MEELFQSSSPRFAAAGVSAALYPALRALLLDVRGANRKLNLLSDDADSFLFQHLLDSLEPLRAPGLPASARIVDVGTGGGFPGLPVLIARPAWRGLLLDSVHKKAEAVRELAGRHAGARAEVLAERAEVLGKDPAHRGAYDLAFCRAVGPLTTVAELTFPLLKEGGLLLAHRGHEAPEELGAGRKALELLGGDAGEALAYDLPGLERKRYIVRIVKIRPTPPGYPRRDGVPAKRPL